VQSCYNLNDLLALSNKTTRVILLRMIWNFVVMWPNVISIRILRYALPAPI
jgi:hypothetical protein